MRLGDVGWVSSFSYTCTRASNTAGDESRPVATDFGRTYLLSTSVCPVVGVMAVVSVVGVARATIRVRDTTRPSVFVTVGGSLGCGTCAPRGVCRQAHRTGVYRS